MLAQMARDGARVGIIAAAGGAADDDADGLAFVEGVLGKGSFQETAKAQNELNRQKPRSIHDRISPLGSIAARFLAKFSSDATCAAADFAIIIAAKKGVPACITVFSAKSA
jgi:hypothetical protein